MTATWPAEQQTYTLHPQHTMVVHSDADEGLTITATKIVLSNLHTDTRHTLSAVRHRLRCCKATHLMSEMLRSAMS
jgi:hypothetical protein